jgi:hypothetical protein
MAYALFSGDDKISRSFETKAELWEHADENGLVVEVDPPEGGDAPRRVLDQDYQIRECRSDTAPADDEDDLAHSIAEAQGRRS